ncbi:hypothetical protein WOLCODRAFT_147060 [Wolfiporia cocos MD-104 SS10]|uniref:Uncharacterized protein n=1 Tax=Wolfiporia cocos (strain MD-104) TaxID=742152 RepID=A0A2H3IS92_WOLCO|nr:hypothetical protein WOLCODRAFT_147060 [Wolfiporia cocos MD-104 SS10]
MPPPPDIFTAMLSFILCTLDPTCLTELINALLSMGATAVQLANACLIHLITTLLLTDDMLKVLPAALIMPTWAEHSWGAAYFTNHSCKFHTNLISQLFKFMWDADSVDKEKK